MRRISTIEIRTSTQDGKMFEFTRMVDHYEDYVWVEVIARAWSGTQWRRIHHWSGRK